MSAHLYVCGWHACTACVDLHVTKSYSCGCWYILLLLGASIGVYILYGTRDRIMGHNYKHMLSTFSLIGHKTNLFDMCMVHFCLHGDTCHST